MRCDQPVPRSGREYLSRYWLRRFQLPYQVLISICLLLPALAGAEDDKYYTWTDAEGRVHSSPIPQKAEKKPSPEEADVPDAPPGDTETYLTEEQVDQKLKKYDQENPPFYIWMDAEGRMQTQTIDPEAEQEAAASISSDASAAITDHILAPPFRLPEEATRAACCEAYADQFIDLRRQFKSLELFDPVRFRPFFTRNGNRQAWYFRIGAQSRDVFSQRFLGIRFRGSDLTPNIIALNAELKPLYQITGLSLHYVPETWRSVDYLETQILIEDPDVAAFILYPELMPSDEISVEIRWANGEPPF